MKTNSNTKKIKQKWLPSGVQWLSKCMLHWSHFLLRWLSTSSSSLFPSFAYCDMGLCNVLEGFAHVVYVEGIPWWCIKRCHGGKSWVLTKLGLREFRAYIAFSHLKCNELGIYPPFCSHVNLHLFEWR